MSSVGYRRPPVATQFRKGQSGNPKGRPRGRRKGLPYDTILGQMVTIREDGRERRVTAAEAFLLQLAKQGLEGDGAAARAGLRAIEAARERRLDIDPYEPIRFMTILAMGFGANGALGSLRMARKLDRARPTSRMKLEPWIVERALARLDRPLTIEEQMAVLEATRTPRKVNWPEWWGVSKEADRGSA